MAHYKKFLLIKKIEHSFQINVGGIFEVTKEDCVIIYNNSL